MKHSKTRRDPAPKNPDVVMFRCVFGEPEHAASLMRRDLPAVVADSIDWDSLRRLDCSFVPASPADRHTDLWFAARIGGLDGFLMLLCDGSNAARSDVPLRCVLRFLECWLDEHEGAEALPPIVPYVLHLEQC